MELQLHYIAPPSPCGYLPEQHWSLEYEFVQSMTAAEYMDRMAGGWRRFGRAVFRPHCQTCRACQPIRVIVDQFRPNRNQYRVEQRNQGRVQLRIQQPKVTKAKLALVDRFHNFQTVNKGWPQHAAKDVEGYINSFVNNPFPTEEWCYYVGTQLVGVGYVDVLPRGMSAIYFFYDPAERHRSLGTWNILCTLMAARERGLPHFYLGYYVEGCQSMTYKGTFRPSEVRGLDGKWRLFRE